MSSNSTQNVLDKAQQKCVSTGAKLTSKRSRLLELLIDSDKPLSAYEVIDRYNQFSGQSMPPMSAYRILDFLISKQLVHKLSSENKYVACSHITCEHEHSVAQFLICRSCQKVKEIMIDASAEQDPVHR